MKVVMWFICCYTRTNAFSDWENTESKEGHFTIINMMEMRYHDNTFECALPYTFYEFYDGRCIIYVVFDSNSSS